MNHDLNGCIAGTYKTDTRVYDESTHQSLVFENFTKFNFNSQNVKSVVIFYE